VRTRNKRLGPLSSRPEDLGLSNRCLVVPIPAEQDWAFVAAFVDDATKTVVLRLTRARPGADQTDAGHRFYIMNANAALHLARDLSQAANRLESAEAPAE
jgi:hypothetical protein